MLNWYPAQSADRDHQDEELDLDALGNPGGARWAWVADEGTGGPFGWCIYKYWLWEDIDGNDDSELAKGTAQTMDEGKLAVRTWLEEHGWKSS